MTSSLSSALIDLVDTDEFDTYFRETSPLYHDKTNIRNVYGLYSFITYFSIPDEKVTEILVAQREFYLKNDVTGTSFTDDEIELILSKDDEAIADYFIQPYAIAKEGNVYSPKWIYTHSVKDYRAAGLSPYLLEEKVEIFVERIPFTEEAKKALDTKIESYARMERQTVR